MQNMDYVLPSYNNLNITDEEFLDMIGNNTSGNGLLDISNSNINNSDYSNVTTVIQFGYPSGYKLSSIIIASTIVTILVIIPI
jgi:hypothetical protein